jgi:hypothetical protein
VIRNVLSYTAFTRKTDATVKQIEECEQSLTELNEAIDGGTYDAQSHFRRGLARMKLCKPVEAAEDFLEVLELQPTVRLTMQARRHLKTLKKVWLIGGD